MDGLEIIREAYKRKIKTRFIIISGYQYFEYALKAIRYNVEDFLIKPLSEKELNEVLKKLVEDIEMSDNQLQIQYSLALVRNHLIQELLKNRFSFLTLMELNEICGFSFLDEMFGMLAVCPRQLDKRNVLSKKEKNIILTKIGKIVTDVLLEQNVLSYAIPYGHILYVLFNYSNDMFTLSSVNWQQVQQDIYHIADLYNGCHINMCVGPVGKFEEIPYIAQSTQECLRASIFLPGKLFFFDNLEESREVKTPSELLDAFKSAIDQLNIEKLSHAINRWIYWITNSDVTRRSLFKYYAQILDVFFDALSQWDLMLESDFQEYKLTFQRDLLKCENQSEIEYYIRNSVTTEFKQQLKTKQNQQTRPIRAAKKYILAHLERDLTLETIAMQVNLNPVYFSILFKNEEGVNYSKYLLSVRLNKAKEKLKNTSLLISHIAEIVGYKDPKHFSKVFKKEVGITPQEYRKLHS